MFYNYHIANLKCASRRKGWSLWSININTIKDDIVSLLPWLHLRSLRWRGRGHGPGSAQWRGRGWGDEGGAGRHHGRPRQHRRPGPAAGRQEARPQGGGQAAPWPGAGVHGLPDAEEPPAEALHRPGGVETLRLLHPVHHHGQLRLPGGLHTLPQRRQQRDERYSGESLSSPSSFYGHIALPVLCPPGPSKSRTPLIWRLTNGLQFHPGSQVPFIKVWSGVGYQFMYALTLCPVSSIPSVYHYHYTSNPGPFVD